jgi:hypothetical protein
MKRFLFYSCVILFIHQSGYSDSCIREKLHTDSYYYGGVTQPAEDGEREVWIGEKKMCSISEGWKVILDINQNFMVIVNRQDSSYVESSLPFEWHKVVIPDLVTMLKAFEMRGTVKQTGSRKRIGHWECQEYEINSYIIYQGDKINETDTKIWASREVLADNEHFSQMIEIMRKFANYDSSYIVELNKINGYQVLRESLFYPKGFSVTSNQKVVTVTQEDPPPGIYDIPTGFIKKQFLSLEELRSL